MTKCWLFVALTACGPTKSSPHVFDAPFADANNFTTFQPCDPSWGDLVQPNTTCQTPCVDMSVLGEDVGCTATSPVDGTTFTCDPGAMLQFLGHHGCCFVEATFAHVDFAQCQ